MTETHKILTEDDARAIAEADAARSFSKSDAKPPFFAPECTTGKNGWIFYLRPDLPRSETAWRIALGVTRKGARLTIFDEREVPERMQEVADTMQSPREYYAQLNK